MTLIILDLGRHTTRVTQRNLKLDVLIKENPVISALC